MHHLRVPEIVSTGGQAEKEGEKEAHPIVRCRILQLCRDNQRKLDKVPNRRTVQSREQDCKGQGGDPERFEFRTYAAMNYFEAVTRGKDGISSCDKIWKSRTSGKREADRVLGAKDQSRVRKEATNLL